MKTYYVYILTNDINNVFYTGMTNDLKRRLHEHKNKLVPEFAKKYNVVKLVFYQEFTSVQSALENEKRIKSWVRKKKIDLITEFNPDWNDLSNEF